MTTRGGIAGDRRTSGRQMLVAFAAAAAALGLAVALSPPERVMGSRIVMLYVHVGAAWTAYLAYAVTALGAVLYLVQRRARWDRLAVSAAELGLLLTTVTLLTGSLWARSTQGWWWVWEPRLTITLLLWFLYAAYLILRQYSSGETRARLSAVLALLGLPAMVLNHFAVVLYRSFHPVPIVVRPDGPALAGPMYAWGLALGVTAFTLLFVTLLAARIRLEASREHLAIELAERAG